MASTKTIMKLVNPDTGLMECRACGSRHTANLKGAGIYPRGSWQCENGCTKDDLEKAPSSTGNENDN